MPFVQSIGVSIPDFTASNSYVKELVKTYSKSLWDQEYEILNELIDEFFEKSGAEKRLWRSSNSLPKDHIQQAVQDCLRNASDDATDKLSSIIFCGIDRGFVEPAHASVLASQLGFNHVRAFDVADACLGWFTACQTATAFATEEKPYSLILSAEFPLDDPGLVLPSAFTIKNKLEFDWKSAALTLGEMATATLIHAAAGVGSTTIRSENQHNELCMVPIKKPWRFANWQQEINIEEQECFLANGSKMAGAGFRPGLAVLDQHIKQFGTPDLIIPHAFSSTVPKLVANKLGIADKVQNVFQSVGNLSTSSIPFSLWSAARRQNLGNLDIVGWVASAGMKHATFNITWLGQEIAV